MSEKRISSFSVISFVSKQNNINATVISECEVDRIFIRIFWAKKYIGIIEYFLNVYSFTENNISRDIFQM